MARPRLVPLKSKSEIDGIRLERVASVAPSMLLYDGIDTTSDDRVAVREYFPAAIATREAGGSGVQPAGAADKAAFDAGLNGFVDHGRALYPFRHKNVVALRAMVEANGTAYLISDHADGAPLDDLLEPGDALVVDEIEEILPGLLDGLAALHHGRLLHRGIAPGAILIRRDGTPILDLPAPAPGADDVAPPFLAPYVPSDWQDAGPDPKGDIYGLGATFYRLITGHEPALATERAAATAAGAADREAAALAELGGDWPRALRETIAACMTPAPGKRPGSVAAVRDLLEGGAPVASPPDAAVSSAQAGDSPPPTIPRRGRTDVTAKTRPTTGLDRPPDANGPGEPDEVSTVWLGSGGARPTELPREPTGPTKPSRRVEPSFRRKAAGAPPAASDDEPATVPVERSEAKSVPDRAPAQRSEGTPDDEPATVPYRRESAVEKDDAPGPGEAAGVIYRRGTATPVRAPAKPTPQPISDASAEERPADAPVVPAGLSLVAPAGLPKRGWRDLVVYLHDPGLASLVAQHIDDNPAPGAVTTAQPMEAQNLIVPPGTRLTAVPVIDGGRVNPASMTLAWCETFHRLDFRLAADPGASPESGILRLFLGPILLAEAALDLSGAAGDPPVHSAVRGFRAPFFSYVAGDAAVVEPLSAAAAHLRAPVSLRAMKRRETPWDRDILPLIEEADVLFIFWSAEASRSANLRKEWEFALELRGPDFIRLISWLDPMPAPPIELEAVPFIRLDPAHLTVPD